jgi:hypothetical protein
MQKKSLIKFILHYTNVIFVSIFFNVSYADSRYLLCGPDEDGCPADGYQYCSCIPYDEMQNGKPYCLDFDRMTCKPLSESPNCSSHFVFKDQAHCLATLFQSEPEPPCVLTTYQFCKENNMYFCDNDGHPENCKNS